MANEITEPERMTKLETQVENIVVVVTRMDTKIDEWQKNFVSKELLEEKLKSRDAKIESQDEKIERLEEEKATNKHILPMWFAVILSAISIIISLWSHMK